MDAMAAAAAQEGLALQYWLPSHSRHNVAGGTRHRRRADGSVSRRC
jgi:hypothetical protein